MVVPGRLPRFAPPARPGAGPHPPASPAAGTLVVALPQTPGAEPLGHAETEAARVAELLRPA
ncbi:hypothetical protein ABZT03_43385, partial [Streptomyces sp. NPDC005574]